MLNVHPSLLPRWRGAAPIERAIMAGDERDRHLDHAARPRGSTPGPSRLPRRSRSAPGSTSTSVSARLADASGRLLVRALDLRAAGELELTEQDEAAATYAEKITAEDRRLDPARDAAELAWAVRGAEPPHRDPPRARGRGAARGEAGARQSSGGPAQGGIEPDEEEGVLVLGTASAGLALETVQPPGKKPMSAAEFMRGYPVPERAI